MHYCPNCHGELDDRFQFCCHCGAALNSTANIGKEQAFLDRTHRMLRWEQKAWRISGIVFIVLGILYAVLFLLLGIVAAAVGSYTEAALSVMFFVYAILFGGMFLAIGIVNMVSAKKINYYLNSLYRDFGPTDKRCGSVGMIVFSAFFSNIALVFFVINFAFMKSGKETIAQIMARQRSHVKGIAAISGAE